MKIVVTGGAGFIGSHVVDAYVAEGHDVIVIDNLSSGKRENVNPTACLVKMDIGDPGVLDLFLAERPDVVNHHAANPSVVASLRQPLGMQPRMSWGPSMCWRRRVGRVWASSSISPPEGPCTATRSICPSMKVTR